MHVTLPLGTSFLIALIAVVLLALFLGIVLWAGRQPYSERQKPTRTQQDSRPAAGGVHEGDPRSVSPHRDKVAETPERDRGR